MFYKIRLVAISVILATLVFNNIGCAAAWFLAGAGTAATAIVATEAAKDPSTEPKSK